MTRLASYGVLLFTENTPVNTLKETDNIYCLELPQARDAADENEGYLLLCWVNLLVVENQYTRCVLLRINQTVLLRLRRIYNYESCFSCTDSVVLLRCQFVAKRRT